MVLDLAARIETLEGTGYGWALLETVAVVALVALAATVVLRLMAPRGLRHNGPIRILARQPIEPRRTLYLIGVGQRVWLVGASEGAFTALAELDPADAAAQRQEAEEAHDFAARLAARLLQRPKPAERDTAEGAAREEAS